MDRFRNVLTGCNLHDLGYKGARFTWTNCRQGGGFTKERLDRALANAEWRTLYQEVTVHILAARSSDHKPLLVEFTKVREDDVVF
jgi:endonuclease/exonuclease/phosphatase (EEP) superfamily protein YafD